MNTIWKYVIDIEDTQEIEVPSGAVFVSVQVQDEDIVLWAIVDPKQEKVTRTVHVVGTGNPMPSPALLQFVDTVQWFHGLVWHIFVRVEDKPQYER